MIRRIDFAAFLVLAALLHVAAVAAFGPSLARAPDDRTRDAGSLRAADPALAELIAHWNTPPETGSAAVLDGPAEEAPPPDTSDAAAAEAQVEAASEVAALGETSGPGKEPKRPIFAAPPKTSTAPPPKLALRAPEPSGFSAPALAAPAASAPTGLGSVGGSPGDGSPGGSLAGLGAGGGLGGGLAALPTQPLEESFAPEAAPLPRHRPTEAELAAARAAQPDDEAQPSIVLEGVDPEPETAGPDTATARPGALPDGPGSLSGPGPVPGPDARGGLATPGGPGSGQGSGPGSQPGDWPGGGGISGPALPDAGADASAPGGGAGGYGFGGVLPSPGTPPLPQDGAPTVPAD